MYGGRGDMLLGVPPPDVDNVVTWGVQSGQIIGKLRTIKYGLGRGGGGRSLPTGYATVYEYNVIGNSNNRIQKKI